MKKIDDKQEFTNALLAWYDEHARILPWRETPTSYRVWVSEIMLQQTRVEAVKPFFERFISALPRLEDLARADDDVLAKLWEGLGYYNRVRNMKKCACVCMERYGGNLPETYDQLLELPGIGAYTAGAVASIAFRECVPAIDGNVLRVFSRVLVSEDDILKESTKKKFQKIVQEYIPKLRSDAFNQALMEIGAMVCVPNAEPRCSICPLATYCIGFKTGQAKRLPNKTAKKQRRIEEKTILVIVYKKSVLLRKRADEGLLAGLYEFITMDNIKKIDGLSVLSKYNVKEVIPLHNAKHIFSHIEWHMNGYLIVLNELPEDNELWVTLEELEMGYAIPTAFKMYREAVVQWLKEK